MKKLFIILFTSLLLYGCKHELERPSWDVEMVFPLIHTKMNLENMLTDSNLNILENNEGFINLVYEEKFIDINLDTLIKIDAITDEKTHTLDSASFADVVISDTATIGETISEIPLGTLLLPNGSTNAIPALPAVANADTINKMYDKYLPLVDRVTTRNELNDVISRLIGELSALHTAARGGDLRSDNKNIQVASLGAETTRDEANGGYRIDYIYKVINETISKF